MSNGVWTHIETYTKDLATLTGQGVSEHAGHVAKLWNKVGAPDFKSTHIHETGKAMSETAIKYSADVWAKTQKLLDDLKAP